jgi:hypothetical protein
MFPVLIMPVASPVATRVPGRGDAQQRVLTNSADNNLDPGSDLVHSAEKFAACGSFPHLQLNVAPAVRRMWTEIPEDMAEDALALGVA